MTGEITIDGDGQQTRVFVYLGDLRRAIRLALESDVGGEVFQIATGVEPNILELAAMVQEVAGTSAEMRHGPARQVDIRRNFSAVGKVFSALGWEPRIALREGLELTWCWARRQGREDRPGRSC